MKRLKQREPIIIGKEYGWLTVTGKAEKDKNGHLMYNVKCRCEKEYSAQAANLKSGVPKCRDCSIMLRSEKLRNEFVGSSFNGWSIIREIGRNNSGAILYECQCQFCGKVTIKTKGSLTTIKGKGCEHCPPNYNFLIKNNIATGILSNSKKFLIDADMVDCVNQKHWHTNEKGYIVCGERSGQKDLLHRLILGISPSDNAIVDHVNRNKLDCRRDNLRIVTHQQNSMNRSISKINTSGFVGVGLNSRKNAYYAKIGLNNRNIHLGTSKDVIICAQMYNIAAQLLFGEYVGHLNDVTAPSLELIQKVEEKCNLYKATADLATQPVGSLFLSA